MAKHILTTGKGKNKRQYELNDEEFAEFQMRFEENELIDVSKFADKPVKLTLCDPKTLKPIETVTLHPDSPTKG